MKKYIFGTIKFGVFVPDIMFRDEVKKSEGLPAIIDIDPKDMKTKAQLGWLFGVVFRIISDYTGYTVQEVYQLFQEQFSSYEKVGPDGNIHKFVKGLSEMSKLEAGEFIDNIARECVENEMYRKLNIPPEPVKALPEE